MPTDAKPQERTGALPGTVPYRREYRDALGRPMDGTVTLTGQARTELGGIVVLPAPVTVELVGGVLDVHLPPDTYTLQATLRTVDRDRTADSDTVTVA